MWRRRAAAFAAMVCVAAGIANCGGEGPTLADYAEDVELAVAAMQLRIVATDDSLSQPSSSLAETEAVWRERVAAREEFLSVIETIDPPDEAAELHAAAERIVRSLADAEGTIGDQVGEYDELSQLNGLGATPAFKVFLDVNDEATNICLAAQGMFDETKQREAFADAPWIPGELKEVVLVMFDCLPGRP